MYAVVIPGMEALAVAELNNLSAHAMQIEEGGVKFSGTWETLFRVNLRARLITRVLLRVGKFQADNPEKLATSVQKLNWSQFIRPGDEVQIEVSTHRSRLRHTELIAQTIRQGIAHAISKKVVAAGNLQRVFVRLVNNRCTISIDTSGERLDRRGYRQQAVEAPVRETIAAAVLAWMDWQPHTPLCNPMCGSGTLAIEAAMLAMKIAPSLSHDFPFIHWPTFKEKLWKRVLDKSSHMQGHIPVSIMASDQLSKAVTASQHNAALAGVSTAISFEQKNIFDLKSEAWVRTGANTVASDVPARNTAGLVVCNPPYGIRLDADAQQLYANIGNWFRFNAKDAGAVSWEMAIFSPDKACSKALGLKIKRKLRLRHGGRWLDILHVRND